MKVCFIDLMPILVLLLLLVLMATYNYVCTKFGCYYFGPNTKTLLSDSTFGVFPGLEYNFLPLVNMCKPIKEKNTRNTYYLYLFWKDIFCSVLKRCLFKTECCLLCRLLLLSPPLPLLSLPFSAFSSSSPPPPSFIPLTNSAYVHCVS